jgi:lactate dehydrogenase-like 2-hydroxyacid dehydrogenase
VSGFAIVISNLSSTQLTDTIDDSLLALNPNLKIVANFAVGYNNIDVKAATARGIPVRIYILFVSKQMIGFEYSRSTH